MYGALLVSFEDDAKNIFIVKKKLQAECFVVDLIGLSARKFCGFHGVGDGYSCLRVGLERNPVGGPQAGWSRAE